MKARVSLVLLLLALAVLVAGNQALTRAQGAAKSDHVMLLPNQLQWAPRPDAPPGAMFAVLSGNPRTEGSMFVMRIKTPDGFKVPPHWHPKRERLTVLQGTLRLGMGKKFDEAALHDLPAGSYAEMPAQTPHFGMSRGETVIQLTAVGPWKIVYVNPADDPTKKPRPAAGPSGAAPMAR